MRVCTDPREDDMDLGAFSVSLAVRDLDASRRFYEAYGFAQTADRLVLAA